MKSQTQLSIESIQEILDRYYLGETTLEEEQLLREFFHETDIDELPADMQADARMFCDLAGLHDSYQLQIEEESTTLPIPEGLDARLQATIDGLAHPPEHLTISWGRRYFGRVAASVAMLFVVGAAWLLNDFSSDAFRDTCSTPEEAQMQMNRALSLINAKHTAALQQTNSVLQQSRTKGDESVSRFISFE